MLHGDNTWLRTGEFAWAVQEFKEPHGNHLAYNRTANLKDGKRVKKITYLLKDKKDIVVNTDAKLKNLFDASSVTAEAEEATWSEKGTKIKFTLENLPATDYTVASVVKGARHGTTIEEDKWSYDEATKTLTLDPSCVPGEDYVVTFESATYANVKVSNVKIAKAAQTITTAQESYTVTSGAKAVNLGAKAKTALTYVSSNSKVAVVDAKGNVTAKGAGEAVITITAAANDNYAAAEKKVKVVVKKAAVSLTVPAAFTKAYGSKAFNIGAKATAGATLTYKTSNSKVATVYPNGTVVIKNTGIVKILVTAASSNTTVTKTATIKVVPKKQTVKAKAGKKKLNVQWKKDSKATGYQIQVATKKNFKGAKTYTVKSYKTYKKVVTKLKSKKKYYVRVRAYKTVGKIKLYGSYSAVKTCKVK